MTKFILTGVIVFLFFGSAWAQVRGTVKDPQGKAVEKSTVSLLRAKDSSVVKLTATTDNGQYSFPSIGAGTYVVKVTHVGYVAGYSPRFEYSGSGELNVDPLTISKVSGDLKEVTITSKKPLVEVKADKTILNVEGTINAIGNDALELLRKSPGVTVDKDDNISLAGKNGVQIYVDGKPTPLSGADLSAYLKSLQSAQIEAIEIITNPSAKYDAAGNAGIINIRLKKNKAFGTNGSVNVGYNQGIYPKYNGGIAFNHRNKGINIFGNYNYNRNQNASDFKLYRELLDSVFNQRNRFLNQGAGHGFKAGMDYFAGNRHTFGFLVNGNLFETKGRTQSRTEIIYKPTMVIDRLLFANNRTDMTRRNVNFNLNYRYADTSGRELNLDADYGFFRIRSNQLQPNYYYTADGSTLISQAIYRFISPTDINIYTLKGDYEQGAAKGRLGIGFKTALINTGNNFGRYNVQQIHPETKTLDMQRSNQFDYSENINAVYLNYNRQLKTLMFQVGLRLENTHSRGESFALNPDGSVNRSSPLSFERDYTDLFPSAAITFNKNPKNQWGISYSRRIDRPAYQDLNPFEFKLDEYTFMKGNTELRPQYTNIITLTNTYQFKLTSSLSYSHVNDVFTQLVDTTEKSKSFLTKKNLATQDVFNLSMSYPFQYKNYSLFANVNANYSHYQADFGGGSRVVDLDVFSVRVFAQNSLKIGKKGWTAEASGWYNSPSIWQGTFKSKEMWSVDAGVQKTIFKGKGNLKFSVSDIFGSMDFSGTSNFAGQLTRASGSFDSRQFRTSLSWRFGNTQVKAARQRKDASEEEKRRTQGGGGLGQQ
ncbi:MAG TPA: TonB-dependent receptor [Chitinophagaceae bacterium]|nr:TonB-dependent receptor [Chitinophagaceae bacterium]